MNTERPDSQDGQPLETETAVVPRDDDGRVVRPDWTDEPLAPAVEAPVTNPAASGDVAGVGVAPGRADWNNEISEGAGNDAPTPLDDAALAMALDKVDQIEKSLSSEALTAAEEWLGRLSGQERESILRQLAG